MNMPDNIDFGYAEVILPKEPYELLTRVGKMAYEFRTDFRKFLELLEHVFRFVPYFNILIYSKFLMSKGNDAIFQLCY